MVVLLTAGSPPWETLAPALVRHQGAPGYRLPRRNGAGTPDCGPAQEMQIAIRARDGRTNAELGAELFLSSRTVEWHLRKVFAKLGIASRRQLRQALSAAVGDFPG